MGNLRKSLLASMILSAAVAQDGHSAVFDNGDRRKSNRNNIDQHNSLNQTKRQRKVRKNRRRIASKMRACNRR